MVLLPWPAYWFDSLAQLKLQRPRGADGGQPLVDHLAQRLRQAADRLGLSRGGEMFEDDNGAMHVIARARRPDEPGAGAPA
jgi:hypothetical protein